MHNVTVVEHPAAGAMLARLRDRTTSPEGFRDAAVRLGALMTIEATRELPARTGTVDSPLAAAPASLPGRRVVAVPVLRAGLGLLPGVHEVFPDAEVGMVGLERDPETLDPREYYRKLPPLEGTWVLVLEPMLATGGSAGAAVSRLTVDRPERLTLLSVVATEQGIAKVFDVAPRTHIVTAAVDPKLDENGYIVPGLGDFGDRVFGTPH